MVLADMPAYAQEEENKQIKNVGQLIGGILSRFIRVLLFIVPLLRCEPDPP